MPSIWIHVFNSSASFPISASSGWCLLHSINSRPYLTKHIVHKVSVISKLYSDGNTTCPFLVWPPYIFFFSRNILIVKTFNVGRTLVAWLINERKHKLYKSGLFDYWCRNTALLIVWATWLLHLQRWESHSFFLVSDRIQCRGVVFPTPPTSPKLIQHQQISASTWTRCIVVYFKRG